MLHPAGHANGLQVANHHALFTNPAGVLTALGSERVNLYYTLAHHAELGKSKPSRDEKTFEYQSLLPFDLDHCDLSRPFDYVAIIAKILLCERSELTVISTGNGLHVLANLSVPIRSAKYQKELKPAYNELLRLISRGMEAAQLPGKPDPVVFDAARVFRLPGTINRKPGQPDKNCELLQYSDKKLSLDIMVLSGVEALLKENVTPENVRRIFPRPDFQEMVKECSFVRWAMEKTEEVHEPQVFDLFSLLAAQHPSSKVEYQGREMSAREVGEAVMDGAIASASLARQDFDRKWEDSSRYGARKCTTISKNWIGGCERCVHNGKIPTPLALKSEEHVGSADNGYWVIGKNGMPLHPHYSDLSKVFAQEKSFVVTRERRLFEFANGHYYEGMPLDVDSWVENKIPNEHLRDSHCSEFLKKVQRVGAMTKAAEEELFRNSINGKLNCRNGVVDIQTGQLLPHSPQYGFQYVLPYDFMADAEAPFFMEWLGQVMQQRQELIDAVLDMMAYCLWPNYDDHVFVYLTGGGSNGKGTLIHVLSRLLGANNVSTVSVPQLGGNRFAPAALEGKLANLSEESSGYRMTVEELNVLKNLSAGGEMFVERKGVQGYSFKNRAKLIFSANKTPIFPEEGHAVRRRMLAIPFDVKFGVPDQRIEDRLYEEIPGLCAMLVKRIQKNVRANGRFLVSRGGEAAKQAQDKILMAGNSVHEWAKERLDITPDVSDYITVADAYHRYKGWCLENTYRPENTSNFSLRMYSLVLPPNADREDNRVRVNTKQVRVFKHIKWKEDI